MARGTRCTVCKHVARLEIDRLLASDKFAESVIARRFGCSHDAIRRHRLNHIPRYLARTVRARELLQQEKVLERLENRIHEVEMLLDACHEYLLDPEDPSRYFLGPRAHEIEVVYVERGWNEDGTEQVRRMKAQLSALLAKSGVEVDHSRYRIADPRRLILEAAGKLESILETIARIAGFMPREPQAPQVQINQQVLYPLMPNVITALRRYPDALAAVMEALEIARNDPRLPAILPAPVEVGVSG